jgi:hypothetical protein
VAPGPEHHPRAQRGGRAALPTEWRRKAEVVSQRADGASMLDADCATDFPLAMISAA